MCICRYTLTHLQSARLLNVHYPPRYYWYYWHWHPRWSKLSMIRYDTTILYHDTTILQYYNDASWSHIGPKRSNHGRTERNRYLLRNTVHHVYTMYSMYRLETLLCLSKPWYPYRAMYNIQAVYMYVHHPLWGWPGHVNKKITHPSPLQCCRVVFLLDSYCLFSHFVSCCALLLCFSRRP